MIGKLYAGFLQALLKFWQYLFMEHQYKFKTSEEKQNIISDTNIQKFQFTIVLPKTGTF